MTDVMMWTAILITTFVLSPVIPVGIFVLREKLQGYFSK